MDVLGRERGSARTSPHWNRQTWAIVVVLGGVLVVVAVLAALPLTMGHRVEATADHCTTTTRYSRSGPSHSTSCDLTLDSTGESVRVATITSYSAGDRVVLLHLGSLYADEDFAASAAWIAVPGALTLLGLAWWLGYPPPTAARVVPLPPRKRQVAFAALVIGAVFAFVIADAIVFATLHKSPTPSVLIDGFVQIDTASFTGESYGLPGDEPQQDCVGFGVFQDVHAGTWATITDGTGSILRTVPLNQGTGSAPTCDFLFTAVVPGRRGPYGITIGTHPQQTFTEAQVRQANLRLQR